MEDKMNHNYSDKVPYQKIAENILITDIHEIDDRDLDFDYPIDIADPMEQNEVSTRNSSIFINFLRDIYQNDDVKLKNFFQSKFTDYSLEYCQNPHHWMSYKHSLVLMQEVKKASNNLNPRSLIEMGKYSARYQTLGPGMDALSLILPLKKVYHDAPIYNRMFNSGQFQKTARLNGNNIIIISKYAEYINDQLIIDQDYWTLGIYLGIPRKRGIAYAEGKIDYSLYKIENLLANEYKFLDVTDYNIVIEEINGLTRKRYIVEGREHAHEIILLKEDIQDKFHHNLFSDKGNSLYATRTHEYEEFDRNELESMIRQKKAVQAMLVTRPFIKNHELVFDTGEIYNAPYTRFNITFEDRNFIATFLNAIFNFRHNAIIFKKGIDAEILAAKLEAVRANKEAIIARANEQIAQQEKNESESRLKITEIYTKKSLVELIRKGSNPVSYQPIECSKAILFCDIRDFAGITESLKPIEVVNFLNSYFNNMNEIILRWNGEIDKLIGDAIMAIFESPDDSVQAAIEMAHRLQKINVERTKHGEKILNIGIGINYGKVIMGNIGSESKLDYTIVGDSVNTASRLEELTKYYGCSIIVSHEIFNNLVNKYESRFLDMITVKGKEDPVKIFDIFDHEPEYIREAKNKMKDDFTKAFQFYKNGDFDKAILIYQEIQKKCSNSVEACFTDPATRFYIRRCKELKLKIAKGIIEPNQWFGLYQFNDK